MLQYNKKWATKTSNVHSFGFLFITLELIINHHSHHEENKKNKSEIEKKNIITQANCKKIAGR